MSNVSTYRFQDVGPAVELTDATRDAIAASKSPNTIRCYLAQWKLWQAYASQVGASDLPADPAHVANWCTARAAAGQALTTIRTGLAAVVFRHRVSDSSFDAGHRALTLALQGLERENTRKPKQAAALNQCVLAAILDGDGDTPADVRDRALIALCYAFGLRASELVSLDYAEIGTGRGVLIDLDDRIELHRVRSKAIKAGRAHVAALRCINAPRQCSAIRTWLTFARIGRGEPVARRIRSGGRIMPERLTEQTITDIMVRRVAEVFRADGRADALASAKQYTSHAARVGLITAGRESGVSVDDLAAHVGQHPSTTAGYARGVDALVVSPFRVKGVGV